MFYKKPRQDPINGENIIIGSKAYQNIFKEYGEPKIRSLKTNALMYKPRNSLSDKIDFIFLKVNITVNKKY